MRIVGLRERGEKDLHDVLLGLLVQIAQELIVALGEPLRRRIDFCVCSRFSCEQLALDAVAPDLVGLGFVLRPGAFWRLISIGPIAREIELSA